MNFCSAELSGISNEWFFAQLKASRTKSHDFLLAQEKNYSKALDFSSRLLKSIRTQCLRARLSFSAYQSNGRELS